MGMWSPDGKGWREIPNVKFREAMKAKFYWTMAYQAIFIFGLQAAFLLVPER